MPYRTDHRAPAANSAAAARIREIGCTLWAPGDWIKHMAASLKIDRRTVQRWAAGEVEVGADVFTKLRNIAADRCREIVSVMKRPDGPP
jgi:hypothetical protein